MDKPNKRLLEQWRILTVKLNFKFNGRREKIGIISGGYGESVHVNFDNKGRSVLTFNLLESISEVQK